jgi:Fanconi anemia group M protein
MFYNILKNSKNGSEEKKIAKKPTVIIDIHEKNSLVPAFLTELGTELIVQKLDVGDYLIGNSVIERKTFQDFIGSMLNKRLIEQLKNMQQYENKILILEGLENKEIQEKSKLNPNAIRGMILSCDIYFKIPILRTKNEEETAIYLFLLAKKQLKPFNEISLHFRIPKTLEEQKKYILESFPGIGPKTAEKLLKRFGSVRKIINATEEELKETLGKKTDNFIDILN